MTDVTLQVDGPAAADRCLILAHGAGAAMDSPFMAAMAEGIAATGIRVVRFEFPYMAARREGRRPPPDRMPVLQAVYADVVTEVHRRFGPRVLVIGGKSMGGRVAVMMAGATGADAAVALGYPFHPAGRPGLDALRTGVVEAVTRPTLICQGERDALGDRAFIGGLTLSPAVQVAWLGDGDHSFKPRRASGLTEAGNWRVAIKAVAGFVAALPVTA